MFLKGLTEENKQLTDTFSMLKRKITMLEAAVAGGKAREVEHIRQAAEHDHRAAELEADNASLVREVAVLRKNDPKADWDSSSQAHY